MSGKATGWARQPKVKCSGGMAAKAVLLLMADHADGQDELHPSIATLAAELGAGERTIQRAIASLVEDGYVEREERVTANGKTTSCRYRLKVGMIYSEEAQGCQSDTPRGATVTPSGVSERRGEGVTVTPSTTLETPLETALSDERAAGERAIFDRVVEVWLAMHPDRVARPRAWAAWQAAIAGGVDAEALGRAVERFASGSGDVKDRKVPALDRWLSDEKYLGRLGAAEPAASPAAAAAFADPEVRALLVTETDEGFVRSYIDPSGWEPKRRAIIPHTGFHRDKIRSRLGLRLVALGLTLAERT